MLKFNQVDVGMAIFEYEEGADFSSIPLLQTWVVLMLMEFVKHEVPVGTVRIRNHTYRLRHGLWCRIFKGEVANRLARLLSSSSNR